LIPLTCFKPLQYSLISGARISKKNSDVIPIIILISIIGIKVELCRYSSVILHYVSTF